MNRSKRLHPISSATRNREAVEIKRLMDCQRNVTHALSRLQELMDYQADYNRRYSELMGQGKEAALAETYRRFLDKLHQAIRQQQAIVEKLQDDCEQQRLKWSLLHRKAEALDKAIDNLKHAEIASLNHLEQKMADDRSQHLKPPGSDDDKS